MGLDSKRTQPAATRGQVVPSPPSAAPTPSRCGALPFSLIILAPAPTESGRAPETPLSNDLPWAHYAPAPPACQNCVLSVRRGAGRIQYTEPQSYCLIQIEVHLTTSGFKTAEELREEVLSRITHVKSVCVSEKAPFRTPEVLPNHNRTSGNPLYWWWEFDQFGSRQPQLSVHHPLSFSHEVCG